MIEPSDEALAKQGQLGDADAFVVLVDRYQRTVLNVAYRMLGDAQDAEDVAQEVFLRAYQSLGRFDPSRPFFSWLYRIAVNCCLTARTRPRPGILTAEAAAALPATALSPEQQVMRDETQAMVQDAVARLPEHERTLIALRYGADLSYDAIALTLHLPLGTVKTRLFRARHHLAQIINEEPDDAPD